MNTLTLVNRHRVVRMRSVRYKEMRDRVHVLPTILEIPIKVADLNA